jgi:hypothetical protein
MGDVDAAIAMSIRDVGMPLVDLTDDGEAGPSGAVKDKPDKRGKQDVIDDGMYNFHSTTPPLGAASTTRLGFRLIFHQFFSNLCNI